MKNLNISIRRSAFFILLLTAGISMLSISLLWIVTEVRQTNDRLENYRLEYEKEQKDFIKSEVKSLVRLIDYIIKNEQHKSTSEIQEDVLNYAKKIRLKYGGYIFINTYQGKALIFDGVKIIGEKDISDMTDPDGKRLFDIEMDCAKKTDGDFFYYKFKPLDSFTPMPKMSYAYGYDNWGWIIGAGIYLNDITNYLESQKNLYQSILFKKVVYIILLFVVLLLILFAVANYLSSFMKKELEVFLSYFNKEPHDYSLISQSDLQIDEFKRLAHSFNIMMQQRSVSEKIIKKERDNAQNYLNIAGVIILALDKEGVIQRINKKGCETLGYKEEEIIGKNWFTHFIPVTEKQELLDRFMNVMSGRSSNFIDSENNIIGKNGKTHIIFWQNTIRYDENGNIIGSLSSGLDLTQFKKVESEFMESETKYKLLFEMSSDPVLLINQDNVFIDCNQATLDILGYKDKKEFIGTSPDSVSPEIQPDGQTSKAKAQKMIANARRDGFTRFEWLHCDRFKNPFYVEVSLTDIPVSGISFLYVVWRIITERKLQEQELLIAKEKAEQSDKIKTSFINNIQHEIRTPLHAIMGFAQLLMQQDMSSEDRLEYYNDILNSGKQLNQTISKIIEFARLQSGFVNVNHQIYELKKLLVNVYIEQFNLYRKSGIQFSISCNNDGKQPLVKLDYQKVEGVLFHLIDNAFKYTEKGSIEISYTIGQDDIVFAVKDSGIGIPKNEFEMIFEMFNTGTPINNNKLYGGNGLGLSISKATLDFIGGEIGVESELEKGSTFYFTIPYRPLDTSLLENIIHHKNKLVLIVTSSASYYQKLSGILSGAKKITTKHIKNGKDVVEYFQDNLNADLIIMDIYMEEMNGITTTKAIKAFNREIPIIIADTELNKNLMIEEALVAGCCDFISKNNSQEEIFLTVLFNMTSPNNLSI